MATSVVTSKGQITIPAEVRAKLGLEVGDRLEFVDLGGGQFGIIAATEDVSTLRGCIRRPPRRVSIQDMNRAIRQRGGKQ